MAPRSSTRVDSIAARPVKQVQPRDGHGEQPESGYDRLVWPFNHSMLATITQSRCGNVGALHTVAFIWGLIVV